MEIKSLNNSKVKLFRSLLKRKARWEKKLFIAEGISIVEEILDNNYDYEYIIYIDKADFHRNYGEFYKKIKGRENTIKVSEEVYRSISDMDSLQGVLAICRINSLVIDNNFPEKGNFILLDKVQDPGNLGTIIRSSDAFKMDGIILRKGTVDPYNSKVIRASMGSIFRQKLYFLEKIEDLKSLKSKGYKIYATGLENSNDIKDIDLSNSIIALGNEGAGVSKDLISLADKMINIPMQGEAESLNVSIAAAIIMYEFRRN